MAFILRLGLQEKRHAKLRREVLNKNPDLEVGYLIKYSTKGGGEGQTYVFAKTDNEAYKKAKNTASMYGKLISVTKSSEMLYDKSKDRYVKERSLAK